MTPGKTTAPAIATAATENPTSETKISMRYPNADWTLGLEGSWPREPLGCAPDVLVETCDRVEVGYSVKTVVVPSLPTEVVVCVVSPRVVVVVETVASVDVVVDEVVLRSETDDKSGLSVDDEGVATAESGT